MESNSENLGNLVFRFLASVVQEIKRGDENKCMSHLSPSAPPYKCPLVWTIPSYLMVTLSTINLKGSLDPLA